MRTVCLVGAFISFIGCLCPYGRTDEVNTAKLVSANTDFGLNLFEKLIEQNSGKNIFISPTSIAIALEMTYNGALGETQKTMADILELQGMNLHDLNKANAALMAMLGNLDDDVQLNIANSLWANKEIPFKSDFLKRNEEFYHAKVSNLDFGDPATSQKVINDWVSEKTIGKIDKIVEDGEIDMDAVLFLINAVYFKGSWAVKFDKEYTRDRDFTLLDGSKKKVPMMASISKSFGSYFEDGFEAVSLPYGSGKVRMYIFLPNTDSSLEKFIKNLNAKNWKDWMSKFREEEVAVILPKFKLEYEVNLNNSLKELGMGIAFSHDANFKGMCQRDSLIDKVKHKTFVDINEEGTEASSATSVKMKKNGGYVIINHPFFCVIRDDTTGAILFMGCIVEP